MKEEKEILNEEELEEKEISADEIINEEELEEIAESEDGIELEELTEEEEKNTTGGRTYYKTINLSFKSSNQRWKKFAGITSSPICGLKYSCTNKCVNVWTYASGSGVIIQKNGSRHGKATVRFYIASKPEKKQYKDITYYTINVTC